MIHIDNPYGNLTGGAWLKGNLHAHTTRSDGARSQQAVLDRYAEMGYGFLSLSDHDTLTTAADYAGLDSHGMIMIGGNEVTANGPHMLHVDADVRVEPAADRQVVLDAIRSQGGFAIVNHPNWLSDFNHCPFENLVNWQGYTGIEVFNGVIQRLEGSPYSADKWDRILTTGRCVWGFANDDSHAANGDDGLGWNVVYVTDRSPKGVVEALTRGRFYASTGVTIDDIQVEDDRIIVRAANAGRISAFTRYGVRLSFTDSGTFEFTVRPDAGYVRFECWGAGETQAWTQPFFVSGE